ncbi:MAG: hypothetical protein QNJ98_07390 [Planctomycetota bacterium]|nr:hypothetical protein [Planctomycetota bacterium]
MSLWKPTQWTMIQGLANREDPEAYRRAWEHLFERYRVLFVRYAGWCLRRMGGQTLAANEAEEVVDAFLADCLEKDWLSRARRDKGQFRTFARTVLARYARDWMDRRKAKKRMPESGPPAHVDDLAAMVGAAEAESIEEEMDREWTEHLIALALAATRGRSRKNAIAIEALMATPDADRAVLAAKLEVQERQVPVNLHRARRMFAEELWEQVKETCSTSDDFLQERSALRPWLEHYLDPETSRSLYGDPTET